jgi:hypothetical protein
MLLKRDKIIQNHHVPWLSPIKSPSFPIAAAENSDLLGLDDLFLKKARRKKSESLWNGTWYTRQHICYVCVNLCKFDHDLTGLPHWNHGLYMGNHPQMAARFRFIVKYYFIYPVMLCYVMCITTRMFLQMMSILLSLYI